MGDTTRTAQGGVGAAVIALGLIALALSAGWLSGAITRWAPPLVPGRLRVLRGSRLHDHSRHQRPRRPAPHRSRRRRSRRTSRCERASPSPSSTAACGALDVRPRRASSASAGEPDEADDGGRGLEQADRGHSYRVDCRRSADARRDGSTVMGLKPGMELSLLDLLYGLLLPSGNDAAIAIAKGVGGTEERVRGADEREGRSRSALQDTHFTNSHGLSEEGLYSSAYDMAMHRTLRDAEPARCARSSATSRTGSRAGTGRRCGMATSY